MNITWKFHNHRPQTDPRHREEFTVCVKKSVGPVQLASSLNLKPYLSGLKTSSKPGSVSIFLAYVSVYHHLLTGIATGGPLLQQLLKLAM